MSQLPDRLRPPAEARFHPTVLQIAVEDVASRLLAEPGAPRSHRQETLYKHGSLTLALFVFERGAQMAPHLADGVVTIHVLEGWLRISAEGQVRDLKAGSLLVLAPGVKHDVHAEEPTRMLLTVCLDVSQGTH